MPRFVEEYSDRKQLVLIELKNAAPTAHYIKSKSFNRKPRVPNSTLPAKFAEKRMLTKMAMRPLRNWKIGSRTSAKMFEICAHVVDHQERR